ncbi:MAG: hypothetical protein WCS70_00075 [Verrucomicrobiota bacterium]
MKRIRAVTALLLQPLFCLTLVAAPLVAAEENKAPTSLNAGAAGNPYQRWSRGPSRAKDFFPITVWGGRPENAARFKAAGINMIVDLYAGPTEKQLEIIRKAGMPVICKMNEVGLKNIDEPLIVGWLHDDEPDMPKKFKQFWGGDEERLKAAWPDVYKPASNKDGYPIPPSFIIRDYEAIKAKDPTRPVLVCLTCGVVYTNWVGRGIRRRKVEDYPEYIKGCDIAHFDIYPFNSPSNEPEVYCKPWMTADGVTRMREYTKDKKVIWNAMECTTMHLSANNDYKLRPRDVRAEVWMSLIRGSMGIDYFIAIFKPVNYQGLLSDSEMLDGVTTINKQVHDRATWLNTPNSATPATVTSSNAEVPVESMTKADGAVVNVYAVAMRKGDTQATFTVPGKTTGTVTVLFEDRTIPLKAGRFEDAFSDWDVHLYEIRP